MILDHKEFRAHQKQVEAVFNAWSKRHKRVLSDINGETFPRKIVNMLSEDLLKTFANLPLVGSYDVYQLLMDYWEEVMQDDVYLIATDGWEKAVKPREVIPHKDKKLTETPDLTVKGKKYKMDLVPPSLVILRYFAGEQAAIEALRTRSETADRELEEFIEEHTGDDGLLEEVVNDNDKVVKAKVNARLKVLAGDVEPESIEERDVLTRCMALVEAESEKSKAVKSAQQTLDQRVLAHYGTLTMDEIQTLVVEDKWFASIRAQIEGAEQRLSQQLAGRVQELEDRYAKTLPELEMEARGFGKKVEKSLRRMGMVLG